MRVSLGRCGERGLGVHQGMEKLLSRRCHAVGGILACLNKGRGYIRVRLGPANDRGLALFHAADLYENMTRRAHAPAFPRSSRPRRTRHVRRRAAA